MNSVIDSPVYLTPIILPLYSALQRRLAAPPYTQATNRKWYEWFNALTRCGVPAAEWEFCADVDAAMCEMDAVVAAGELLQWLVADDGAQVNVFLREIAVYPALSFFSFSRDIPVGDKPWNHPARPQACWHYYNPVHDFRIVSQRNRSVLGCSDDWMVLNRHWELWRYKKIRSPYFVSASEAKRWCENVVKTVMPLKRGILQPSQQWAQYSTKGGAHYREWLITLPNHRPLFDAAENNTHFDVNNVIAHLRTTDRCVDGNDVLFIEEVQSDWNQQLRYADADIRQLYDNPYRTQWVALVLRVALLLAARDNKSGLALATGEMNEARYRGKNPSLVHFYNHMVMKEFSRLANAVGASIQMVLLPLVDAMHSVPVVWISDALREKLITHGLPRLGAVPPW